MCLGIALETLARLDQNHAGEYVSNLTVLDDCVPVFKTLLRLSLVHKHRHTLLDLTHMNCLESELSALKLGHVLNQWNSCVLEDEIK